ncbi:MAG: Hint domain-containing protein, partial [Pseudomonadota bacterium]
ENLVATDNSDTIDASADSGGVDVDAGGGTDTVVGGSGADTIDGGDGDDSISGGAGGDSIDGGSGDDTINVAQGDTVTGGDGDDYFNIVDLGEVPTGTIEIVGGEGDETGGDTLALNGLHDRDSLVITDPDDVNGGLTGTVTLLDGTVVNFTNIENIICFVPGALIATPSGLRAIEDLKVGDTVITQDNGVQTIRWKGFSTVSGSDRFAPVRFSRSMWPGAMDDLVVSPQHRMLVKGYQAEMLFGQSEVLVPAVHMVDGCDVLRETQDSVTYVHVMFDQHEIIFANGIPTESFHPGAFGVDALAPGARDEMFDLFPELRSDLARYGASARASLKSKEAQMLMSF